MLRRSLMGASLLHLPIRNTLFEANKLQIGRKLQLWWRKDGNVVECATEAIVT